MAPTGPEPADASQVPRDGSRGEAARSLAWTRWALLCPRSSWCGRRCPYRAADTHGTWEVLPDGGRIWRLRIAAPGATDLNFGFTRFDVPAGATLHVLSEAEEYYEGPYGIADAKPHGQLWTPVVPGDRAVIELRLPPGASQQPDLVLGRVGRGYRDLFFGGGARTTSCNNDVICPVADAWRDEIRSVARYTIEGASLCTGTLVTDVPGDFRPFFLTANHCGLNPGNAPTVVTYWNFESPTCGQNGGGSLTDNQSGATFLASRTDVDMALIELDEELDPAFGVYYSGWDATAAAPAGSVGIHHPSGGEKSISFNTDPLTTGPTCSLGGIDTHWIVDDWEDGTTEVGTGWWVSGRGETRRVPTTTGPTATEGSPWRGTAPSRRCVCATGSTPRAREP